MYSVASFVREASGSAIPKVYPLVPSVHVENLMPVVESVYGV